MGAEYHVAITGSDEAAGTAEAPFRSIGCAAKVMIAGDRCVVHEGAYRETVSLAVSGTKDQPIRFQAAAGEHVLLSGSEVLDVKWRPHRGGIHRAAVTGPVHQLFADGTMLVEARWPNLSLDDLWNRNRWAKASKGSRYGKMTDPALAESGIDWTGAVATLNVAHQFFTWSRTVKHHEKGENIFLYERDLSGITHYADKTRQWEDDRYYLSGKLEALDVPGEWFYDAVKEQLYLWPPAGSDPATLRIESKTRDFAFDGDGVQFVELAGFRLVGCTIRLKNANHCLISDCHVTYPNWARRIDDPEAVASDKTVTEISGNDNRVLRSSFGWGPTTGLRIVGRRNIVEECLFHDFCWDGSLRQPVIALSSREKAAKPDRCIVRRCTVYNGGNALINYRGFPGHIIEYSHFYNGGLCCKDVALVYTGQPSCAGSIVRYNWVHGCRTEHRFKTNGGFISGGLGIRGDDQTRQLTVHHNVVWDCGRDGIIVKGDHNRVCHNTVLDIGKKDVLGNYVNLHTMPEPVKAWRKQHPLLKVQNEHSLIANNAARTITGDNKGKAYPFAENMRGNFTGADPMLIDPANLDFRPRKGSPLIDTGKAVRELTGPTIGATPDIGAYEFGGENWRPGISWDPKKVLGQVPKGFIPTR